MDQLPAGHKELGYQEAPLSLHATLNGMSRGVARVKDRESEM